MKNSKSDEDYMRETLRLAEMGRGFVNPNPMVGAVIVRKGRVVARGYHRISGGSHAEIEALSNVRGNAAGTTLYVNLEPCCHFGRTPPCTDALIRAKIARIVCATRDSNKTARGGLEKLRRAGIDVSIGSLKKEARDLNESFFTFHERQRPFVALKFAASLDGKLATRSGDSKWITSKPARAHARRLRGSYQAVVVGVETVMADDPHLGARIKKLPDPLRVILDSTLRISLKAQVLRDSHVIIATTKRASALKKKLLERRGIRVLTCGDNHIAPRQLLASLKQLNIISVLVEGGGAVLGSFIDAGFVDKVYAFYAPILIGGENAVSIGGHGAGRIATALHLSHTSVESFGSTVLITASTNRP